MLASLRRRLAAWIKRRQGCDTLPLSVHRRRLYILPTRAGIAFAVLLFFMAIAALNYSNSLALFLTFLLAGFALVAMHQCHRNLLNLIVAGVEPRSAFAGEPAAVSVTLTNDRPIDRPQIILGALEACATTHLHQSQRVELPVPTAKRGRLIIDRLELATTFPFGLFRAWAYIHLPIEIIVYPRARGSLPMPYGGGQRLGTRAYTGSGTEEWMGLRPFRDGDSPRQVAWKAYARGAPLLVKEYAAAGSELRIFEFEKLQGLDVEARLEQLSRWIVEAEARGETYGLIIADERIAPDRGPAHRHRCLRALALYGS